MELTDRQRAILRKLIRHYIRTAQPVSSRELAEYFDFSSATIRNELKVLEESGLLDQPHTSAGRVPTDDAYRWRVDQILSGLRVDGRRMKRIERAYDRVESELDDLLDQTLGMLSDMSGYLAWAVLPDFSELEVSRVEMAPVNDHSLMLILVTGRGVIKNRIVPLPVNPQELDLAELRTKVNNYISGRSLHEVEDGELSQIFREVREVPGELVDELAGALGDLAHLASRMETSSASPLLKQPEFQEPESVVEILESLQESAGEVAVVSDGEEIRVTIGSENEIDTLRECSVISTPYSIGGEPSGSLGVLGPTRLSYEETIPLVESIGRAMSEILADNPTQA